MANYHSRSPRERRLRARYRKRIWTCGIIMLIVGLVLGYVLSVMYLDKPSFLIAASATPTPRPVLTVTAVPTAESTEEPTAVPTEEPTEEPTAVPTAEIIAEVSIEPAIVFNSLDDVTETSTEEPTAVPKAALTEEPTAEPTEEPTAEPTEEPTAEPTEEPTAEPTEEPTAEPTEEPTAEPTEEPTAEPTEEPTPEPTAEPTPAPVIVPFGESCSFDTQITADGSARMTADDAAYETLNLTLKVDAYRNPTYFEKQYSDTYKLQGNEAVIEFDLTLNGYTGTTEIIPQNFLMITCCGEDESVTAQSFQLMDSEIAGKTNIAITSDVTSTLFKRYDYNADQGDMVYMVVTAYNDGKENSYWFEIQGPEEEPVAEAAATETGETGATAATGTGSIDPDIKLTIGSRGDDVKKLQAKLIELGQLQGQPDGQFGKYTAGAVQVMQEKFGMEKTGVADAAFLEKLYSE